VNARTVALLVVLAGGAYYLTRRDEKTGASLADSLLAGIGLTSGPTPAAAGRPSTSTSSSPYTVPGYVETTTASGSKTGAIVGTAATAAGAILPTLGIGGGAAAAGGGAAGTAGAAGAGIGLAGALVATGIAAGAALLVWGIWKKGLFRGGEEGIIVNPMRDEWFDYYIQHSSWAGKPLYGKTPIPGATSVQTARYEAYLEVARRARVPESEIDRTLTAIYKADTRERFVAAAQDVEATFRKYETNATILRVA
jgi:hypothetical protein